MTAKNLDLTSDDDDPEEAEHNFKMVLKLEAESEYSSTRNKLNLSGKPSQRKILTLDVLWILFKMTFEVIVAEKLPVISSLS